MSQKRTQSTASSLCDDHPPKRRKTVENSFEALFKDEDRQTEDRVSWLTELRDIALEMDDKGRRTAKAIAGSELWSQLVHLNVPKKLDGAPRSLKNQVIRGIRITDWDLVPTARTESCNFCTSIKSQCENTVASKPHQKCRRCLFKQKPCVVGIPFDESSLPASLKSHFNDPTREANKQSWLIELRRRILQMTPEAQKEIKEQLPPSLWADLVHLSLPLNHEGKVRALTGVVNKITGWDLVPTLSLKPCESCLTRVVPCEYANVEEPGAHCRRCALKSLNEPCSPVSQEPPQEPNPAQEQMDHLLYVDFVNIHNDKQKKDSSKRVWLEEMRDMVLQMTRHKQDEVKAKLGDVRWAQMVSLNLREGRPVSKQGAVKVADWDLVPIQAGAPCDACKTAGVTCMYTNMRELDGACRECALVGSECVRKSPQMDNIMTDEMIMKKFRSVHSAPPTTPSSRRTWLKELRDLGTRLDTERLRELREEIGDELWCEIIWNSSRIKGKKLEGTTVDGVPIVSWSLIPITATSPCERCASLNRNCVHSCSKESDCRECLLEDEKCGWSMEVDLPPSQADTTNDYDEIAKPLPGEGAQDSNAFTKFWALLAKEVEASERDRWFAELHDLAVTLDLDQQEAAKKRAGEDIWANIINVSLGGGVDLIDGKIGGRIKISDWDLSPVQFEESCETCVARKIPCDRMQKDVVGNCRMCRLKRKACSNRAVPASTHDSARKAHTSTISRTTTDAVEETSSQTIVVEEKEKEKEPAVIRQPKATGTRLSGAKHDSQKSQPVAPRPELASQRDSVSALASYSTTQSAPQLGATGRSATGITAQDSYRDEGPLRQSDPLILSSISRSELRLLDRLERELERKDRELDRKEEELHAMRIDRMEREKQMRAEREALMKEIEKLKAERDMERTARVKGL